MNRTAKRLRFLPGSRGTKQSQSVQILSPASICSEIRTNLPDRFVSEAEVARLVSAALNDALTALKNRDPETFLHLRACDTREAMREMTPVVKRERADIGLDLALEIVNSIRRYDRLSRWRTPERSTEPHEI